ncbi:MAG: tetratricopeptide repeat protein [Hyphomicrobiales bacterium]|nr:tetratricopeptide repeat protein [Hyphomicrobiales bacterium]
MSDDSFIREVDDELRHDQAKQLWDRYGNWVIAAAVAIVVATGGYRGWEYYSKSVAAKSGDRFMQAIQLSDDGSHDKAIKILNELVNDGSGQYPALAKLRIASELATRGDIALAIENYDQIAADNSFVESFRLIARLRAGLLAVDANDLDDVTSRLQALAGAGLPFRHSAREGLGLANFKAGKFLEARKWFDAIANDADAGSNLRSRANIMLDLLAGKGISKEKAGT